MNRPPETRPAATPDDWDLLQDAEIGPDDAIPPPAGVPLDPATLVAAAWGDLVSTVAVVTAALAAVLAAGRPVALGALPWAAGLALTWWLAASSVLLVVRRASPGMLMAGVVLERAPRGGALLAALVAGLLGAATLGLATWPVAGRSLISRAAGSRLLAAGEDGGG